MKNENEPKYLKDLSPDEMKLILQYRMSDEETQKLISATYKELAREAQEKKAE